MVSPKRWTCSWATPAASGGRRERPGALRSRGPRGVGRDLATEQPPRRPPPPGLGFLALGPERPVQGRLARGVVRPGRASPRSGPRRRAQRVAPSPRPPSAHGGPVRGGGGGGSDERAAPALARGWAGTARSGGAGWAARTLLRPVAAAAARLAGGASGWAAEFVARCCCCWAARGEVRRPRGASACGARGSRPRPVVPARTGTRAPPRPQGRTCGAREGWAVAAERPGREGGGGAFGRLCGRTRTAPPARASPSHDRGWGAGAGLSGGRRPPTADKSVPPPPPLAACLFQLPPPLRADGRALC